jgi:hypothetical protein
MDNQNNNILTSGYITEKETLEFFSEGLKQAASAARQLASAQSHEIWKDISLLLDELHNNGIQMACAKSLGRQKTLQILNHRETIMNKKLDDKRAAAKPKFLLN